MHLFRDDASVSEEWAGISALAMAIAIEAPMAVWRRWRPPIIGLDAAVLLAG